MKNCKRLLSVLMLVSLFVLTAFGTSAQILPNNAGASTDGGGMRSPAEDLMPRDGKFPEAIDDMMPHAYDGVIHDGHAEDGRVDDGARTPDAGEVIDDAVDGGISGTVWGILIAVGIAALAVLFIFLLMPKDRDRERSGRRD